MSLGVIMAATVAAVAPSAAITPYPVAFFAARQPSTALDMVRLLPGFTLDAGDQVRGFAGSAGNVLIDGGRPASKDDPLDEILKRIPASSVDHIDVIRGGAPGIDMQGKTILANIVRKPATGTKIVIGASGTLLQDGRVGFGSRLEGSRTFGRTTLEGSLMAGRGFDDGAGDGVRTQPTASGVNRGVYRETSGGTGVNWKAMAALETPAFGGKLRVNGSVFLNPYHYRQVDAPTSAGTPQVEDDHDRQRTAEFGLRYDHTLGPAARLETFLLQQVGENRYAANYAAPGDMERFVLIKDTAESIARTTVNLQAAPGLALETGGEADFNWLHDHTDYTVNGTPTAVPAANVRITEVRVEGFASGTWKPAKVLTIEAGARVEISRIASSGDVTSGRAFMFLKPRLVATWSPTDVDQVRLRLEREVGQLNFDDFAAGAASLTNGAVHAGNPRLTPQQNWMFEAAYDRKFPGGAQATLTLRHAELSDVIDRAPIYDPGGTYDAPGNIGPGTRDEASLNLTIPTDRLGLRNGSLTARGTTRRSSVTDPTTGLPRPISGLHSTDAQIHFTHGLPRWKATWGFDYFDQWRETYYRYNEVDTDRLKSFAVLFAEYKPRPDLSFRFEFNNVGARAFRHVRQIYPGPRNAYPLDYTDIRDLRGDRSFYIRIRKTFG